MISHKSINGILTLFFLALYTFGVSQTPIEGQIDIWPSTAPGSDTVSVIEEIEDRNPDGPCYLNRVVKKVTNPTIKHFAPEKPNGRAVLLCPGGGYALLAYDKEGYDLAEWLNERDITAFVLKYRLPIDGHENRELVALQDAQRAIRYIRANAETFNINPDSIGIFGGCAGGHLAASLSVHYDWETYVPFDDIDTISARPDLSILMYPVISFQDELTHSGSRTNLLGDVTQTKKDSFSTEMHVDSETPKAFLFHSKTDGSVKYGNSEAYAEALTNAGVSNSLNLYKNGGHGVGKCEAGFTDFSQWPNDLDEWLVENEWTTPCTGEVPVVTIIDEDPIKLVCSDADSYQWYRNGVVLDGKTDSEYVPVISADYKVAVKGTREGSGSECLLFSEEMFVDITVGISELSEFSLNVYPNPANSTIVIDQVNVTGNHIDYEIFNESGASITSGQVENSPKININIDTLSSGMYFIQLKDDTKVLNGKFLKN